MGMADTFAYVANWDGNAVLMFAIDATTGVLTALSTPTVAAESNPISIVFKLK
jgi:6-phosphogluconolactonase (cycloisomerase 2 family)